MEERWFSSCSLWNLLGMEVEVEVGVIACSDILYTSRSGKACPENESRADNVLLSSVQWRTTQGGAAEVQWLQWELLVTSDLSKMDGMAARTARGRGELSSLPAAGGACPPARASGWRCGCAPAAASSSWTASSQPAPASRGPPATARSRDTG